MKLTNKLTIVFIVLIIFPSLSISVYGEGEFKSSEITISVDNTPPEVDITEPANVKGW
jgi:hypothetical protein